MQEVNDLAQRFLRFILPRYVLERLARFRRNIDFRTGFPERHRVRAHFLRQLFREQLADAQDDDDRHQPHQHIHQEGILLRNNRRVLRPALFQPLCQRRVVGHNAGHEHIFLVILDRVGDLAGLVVHFYLVDLFFIQGGDQVAVTDFLDPLVLDHRRHEQIERHQRDQHHEIIIN